MRAAADEEIRPEKRNTDGAGTNPVSVITKWSASKLAAFGALLGTRGSGCGDPASGSPQVSRRTPPVAVAQSPQLSRSCRAGGGREQSTSPGPGARDPVARNTAEAHFVETV